MIVRYTAKPVFRYTYRPLGRKRRDSGFSVTLFEDSTVRFCAYDVYGFIIQDYLFSVVHEVLTWYRQLMADNHGILVRKMPDMVAQKSHSFGCVFGFEGFDPIYIVGLDEFIQISDNDATGFIAKRIFMLFESVSNLLLASGLYMSMDQFVWFPHAVILHKSDVNAICGYKVSDI